MDKVTEAGREAMQRRKRIKIPPLDYVFVTPTRFGIYAFRRGWNLPKLQREVLLIPRADVEGISVSRNHPVFFHVTLQLAQNREIKMEYSRGLDDRFIKMQAQLGMK